VRGRRVLQFLHVGRNDERGRRAHGHGDPDSAVEHVGQLLGDGDHLQVVTSDVLVQAHQVDFLLVGATHGTAVGLPDDGQHGHVVELGVVQAVEQVDGTGPGGGHADPEAAAELGVANSLERGHFLVPGLDELRLVVGSHPGSVDAVDPVARVGKDLLHAPLAQSFQQVVGNFLSHALSIR